MPDGVVGPVLRLYVAGNGPNSDRARTNLRDLCDRHLPDGYSLEIVDVFDDPGRALAEGVLLTPMLVIASAQPPRRVLGSLDEPNVVLAALGLQAGIP